jgi:hypothetical protein
MRGCIAEAHTRERKRVGEKISSRGGWFIEEGEKYKRTNEKKTTTEKKKTYNPSLAR